MPVRTSPGFALKPGAGSRKRFKLLCLLVTLGGLGGCGNEAPRTRLESPAQAPDQVLWDFTTTDSDSGRLRWVLDAREAQIFEKTKMIEAQGIEVDIYGRETSPNSVLTADSGRFDRNSGDMTAWGRVHVVSEDDYELHTSILYWDNARELFHTDAYVEVRQGENLYTGYDMECDQRIENLRILREPRGIISQETVPEGE
jgi:LPS export ABC transporter protein LptC